MTTPVFVIHGIGNRDKAAFVAAATTLARSTGIEATPVYWGDLGAKYEWISQTIPDAPVSDAETRDDEHAPLPEVQALAEFLLGAAAQGGAEIRSDHEVPEVLLEALASTLGGSDSANTEEVRDGELEGVDPTAVSEAVAQYWSTTRWLPAIDDEDLLRAIGEAIAAPLRGEAESDDGNAEVRGEELRGVDIVGFVRRRLHDVDRIVGATINVAAGRLNTAMRTKMLPGITRMVGDILVYQRHRHEISDRVRSVIAEVDPRLGQSAEHPVDVIAHSLGGVITFDMATADQPLWVRRFVTFGSQSSFFHVCDPRGGKLAPYAGTPATLPPSLGAWTNLWEPMDLVAFIAGRVFLLHDGSTPQDIKVPHLASAGIWTHSSYWTTDFVAKAIRTALSG